MMWLSLLLILFFGTPTYQHQVAALNMRGCHVYNDYYVSCADSTPPPGAIPIPDDAVEVIINRSLARDPIR